MSCDEKMFPLNLKDNQFFYRLCELIQQNTKPNSVILPKIPKKVSVKPNWALFFANIKLNKEVPKLAENYMKHRIEREIKRKNVNLTCENMKNIKKLVKVSKSKLGKRQKSKKIWNFIKNISKNRFAGLPFLSQIEKKDVIIGNKPKYSYNCSKVEAVRTFSGRHVNVFVLDSEIRKSAVKQAELVTESKEINFSLDKSLSFYRNSDTNRQSTQTSERNLPSVFNLRRKAKEDFSSTRLRKIPSKWGTMARNKMIRLTKHTDKACFTSLGDYF